MVSIKTVLLVLIASITFIVFGVQAYFMLSQFHDTTLAQIRTGLISQAEKEANQLYVPIRMHANDALSLAELIETVPQYDEALTMKFMEKLSLKNDAFSGHSLAFEPGVINPVSNFYLLYVYRDRNNQAVVDWSYNDGHYFRAPWYNMGMNTNSPFAVSPPYRDVYGKNWISIVSPIIKDNKRIGVATADFTLDKLQEYVNQLKVGKNGYAYIVTSDGTYLGTQKLKGLVGQVSSESDPEAKLLGETILADNDAGFMELKQANQFVAYAPIGETGLKLALVYMGDEIGSILQQNLRNAILFFCSIMIIYIAILTYVINRRMLNPLVKLSASVNQVASGNLSLGPIEHDYNDEIKQVYNSFYNMVISLRTAQADIDNYTKDLVNKNAELERFTYTVSHDLRSPLITIKGFAGIIGKDIAQGKYERVQSDLSRIKNATNKMAELLDGLLELSRIGRMANPSENVSLTKLSKEVVELLHESIQAKKIDVRIQEEIPEFWGDKNRIREVMQNLIENAIKFMDKPNGKIVIGYITIDDEIIYFVNDNGPGIAPQYFDKIFGLFDKLDNHEEGSGIGLALVKRIIEFHGGQIWVESEPGNGAEFFFTIKTKTEPEESMSTLKS